MSPLISVIIPVYNSAEFLEETLKAIRSQSLPDWELICVDNGSTDISPEILKAYAAKDERIRFLTLPPVGAGAARNAGLDEARGTYVCMCDSDDLYTPTALEHMYQLAKETQADVVIGGVCMFNEQGKTWRCKHFNMKKIAARVNPHAFCPREDLADMLFEMTRPWTHSKLYRREHLNAHNIRYTTHRRAEDLPFSYLSAALAKTVTFTETVCYLYRQRGNSLSHTLTQEPHIFLEALLYTFTRIQEEQLPASSLRSYLRAVLAECICQPKLMTGEDARACWEKIRCEYEPQWHLLPTLADDTEVREKYQLYKAQLAPEQRIYIDLSRGWQRADETVRSIRSNPAFCAEIAFLTQSMPAQDTPRLEEFLQHHYDVCAMEHPAADTSLPCYILRANQAVTQKSAPNSWEQTPRTGATEPQQGIMPLFRFCGWENLHDGFRWMIGRKCALRYHNGTDGRSLHLARCCLFKRA